MKMKEFIKENNVSFVFECVDMKNDPHIIEYPESELFLLDIVKNDMEFSKYEYDQMVDIANQFGLTHKEKAFEIATWQEFYDWYYDVLESKNKKSRAGSGRAGSAKFFMAEMVGFEPTGPVKG